MVAARALHALAPPLMLAAGTGLVVALMVGLSGSHGEGSTGGVRVKSQHSLLIAEVDGQDAGITPGTIEARSVRLTNPNDSEVQVRGITAATGTPVDRHGRPVAGCLPTVAQVQAIGAPVRVPPNSTRHIAISVRLAATVQRACKRLEFPLVYAAMP